MTALAKTSGQDHAILERAVVEGDLAKLTPQERTQLYSRVCESLGLNPLTQPFQYLRLNGQLRLYAARNCTDQLRKLHSISVRITSRETVNGIHIVTAQATTPDGREDESTGAVPLGNLKGDNLANALMKAETKAKRRVTLSICGLSWMDETELETVRGAKPVEAESVAEIVTKDDPELAARVEEGNQKRDEERELIKAWDGDLERMQTEDAFFGWVYANAKEIDGLDHRNKGPLFTVLKKHAKRIGFELDDRRIGKGTEAGAHWRRLKETIADGCVDKREDYEPEPRDRHVELDEATMAFGGAQGANPSDDEDPFAAGLEHRLAMTEGAE